MDLLLRHLDMQSLDLSDDLIEKTELSQAYGGSCEVFRAKSLKHGISIAVKKFRVHAFTTKQKEKDPAKEIIRELAIWSTFNHPNVLKLLGYVMDGNYPALVSQWMAKGSMRAYMTDNPNICVIRMAKGIADGLLYLHELDVIHADLKGDNILISDSGVPKLTDFGISKILNSTITTSTDVKGTARWMAVELISPKVNEKDTSKHTKQSDVWAYGMVLYEILTGKIPFEEEPNELIVILELFRGQLPRRPEILNNEDKQFLWSMCQFCWKRSPAKRPKTTEIRNALSGERRIDELEKKLYSNIAGDSVYRLEKSFGFASLRDDVTSRTGRGLDKNSDFYLKSYPGLLVDRPSRDSASVTRDRGIHNRAFASGIPKTGNQIGPRVQSRTVNNTAGIQRSVGDTSSFGIIEGSERRTAERPKGNLKDFSGKEFPAENLTAPTGVRMMGACFNCRERGHHSRDCIAPGQAEVFRKRTPRARTSLPKVGVRRVR